MAGSQGEPTVLVSAQTVGARGQLHAFQLDLAGLAHFDQTLGLGKIHRLGARRGPDEERAVDELGTDLGIGRELVRLTRSGVESDACHFSIYLLTVHTSLTPTGL